MSALHTEMMGFARKLVADHIQEDDGEKCFNRYTFLEALESKLECNIPTGRFEINSTGLARYLYCCLCSDQGDAPDGDTFAGMPILD